MPTVTSELTINSKVTLQPGSPHSGGLVHPMLVQRSLGHGTGAYQADKVYQGTLTLDTTGTEIDLQTKVDALNVAMGLDEVVTLIIEASSANTAAVNITGGASNPWEAFLLATGDGLKLAAGAVWAYHAPLDGALPVTGSAKTLKLAAVSGTQSVTIQIVGRSQ